MIPRVHLLRSLRAHWRCRSMTVGHAHFSPLIQSSARHLASFAISFHARTLMHCRSRGYADSATCPISQWSVFRCGVENGASNGDTTRGRASVFPTYVPRCVNRRAVYPAAPGRRCPCSDRMSSVVPPYASASAERQERIRSEPGARFRLAEGDSPDQARYSTANRPSSQKPKLVAISVTVVVDGSAARSAR